MRFSILLAGVLSLANIRVSAAPINGMPFTTTKIIVISTLVVLNYVPIWNKFTKFNI